MTARLKAVWQEGVFRGSLKALSGIGRSTAASHETRMRGLPCPDGHKSSQYTVSLKHNNNIRFIAVL